MSTSCKATKYLPAVLRELTDPQIYHAQGRIKKGDVIHFLLKRTPLKFIGLVWLPLYIVDQH